MKRLVLLVLLAGCASTPTGDPAPTFQLAGLDGKTVRAEDLWSDRPVLLVFMTAW